MLTRMLFLVGLVLCGIVALTGAWPASLSPIARDADSAFVPKAVPLDAEIIGSGIDARQLLTKALAKLGDVKAAWLHTKIRQTVCNADTSIVAEGFLQRGPNQCVRMEMEVVRDGVHSRLVMVSDGEILAQVQKLPGGKPIAVVERLPAVTPEASEKSQAAREAFLDGKSCGGPAALLRPILQHLQAGKLQTGLYHDRPVIQLNADLDPSKILAYSAMKLAALSACVYLDAKTLWPVRIEWWGADNARTARPLANSEFHDPIIGLPLADEASAHMFSYRPDGTEQVSEARPR